MTSVSVCVPVYRDHDEPNISTLAASLDPALAGLEGELVVALNGIAAEGLAGRARLVDLGVNRGVAPGWNAAARAASGEVLVFANDDVVLGPHSLATMHAVVCTRPEAGVVGPVGARWDLASARHVADVAPGGHGEGALAQCDAVSGFLFATRRDTFEQLGGFDEFYAPCSFEEIDFCTAVRLRLGLRCYVAAGIECEHTWGISARMPAWRRIRYDGRSETLRSIHRRNRRHFLEKWRPVLAEAERHAPAATPIGGQGSG